MYRQHIYNIYIIYIYIYYNYYYYTDMVQIRHYRLRS